MYGKLQEEMTVKTSCWLL